MIKMELESIVLK